MIDKTLTRDQNLQGDDVDQFQSEYEQRYWQECIDHENKVEKELMSSPKLYFKSFEEARDMRVVLDYDPSIVRQEINQDTRKIRYYICGHVKGCKCGSCPSVRISGKMV